MIVSITQHRSLPMDGAGNVLPISGRGSASQTFTANGGVGALGDQTKYVRVSSSVPLHLGFNVTATASTHYHPAGTEFYEVRPGQALNFIEAAE
jgi:hypothetical protein